MLGRHPGEINGVRLKGGLQRKIVWPCLLPPWITRGPSCSPWFILLTAKPAQTLIPVRLLLGEEAIRRQLVGLSFRKINHGEHEGPR